MKKFQYTKSPELSSKISLIDSLRTEILLKPISPANELELQWNTLLDRIHFSFQFRGNNIAKDYIAGLLTPARSNRLTPLDKEIVRYKSAIDYIYYEWLVSDEPVRADTLFTLYEITFNSRPHISKTEIDSLLSYVQINPEHPILQASIAQCLLLDLSPFGSENERLANLLFNLFVYKNGYDFRRMFDAEEFFYQTIFRYKETKSLFSKSSNLTEWIEYVTEGTVHQLNKVINNLTSLKNNVRDSYVNLEINERQKKVLSFLQQPGLKVSNKNIQEMFNVSQITASRDLSKLASLGLVVSIGKGRSTYYTKI